MYRGIVSLCFFVLIGGSFACVAIDDDDDFEEEGSPVTEDDEFEADKLDNANFGDEDSDIADSGGQASDNSPAVSQKGANVTGVRLSFFALWEEELYRVMDPDLEEGVLGPDFLGELPLSEGSHHHYAIAPAA